MTPTMIAKNVDVDSVWKAKRQRTHLGVLMSYASIILCSVW